MTAKEQAHAAANQVVLYLQEKLKGCKPGTFEYQQIFVLLHGAIDALSFIREG
jgi:hypothetical protein